MFFKKVFLLLFLVGTALSAQTPMGTAFTYQGRLADGGSPANGIYDLRFRLYDSSAAGNQVGNTFVLDDITVTNGLFTTQLDFGGAFTGDRRWLEIDVRAGASTGAYTTLTPRQELTAAPNALFAANAATVAGLSCTDNQVPKWSNGAWTCGADLNSSNSGTVTNVNTGAGLTGGPITTSGTISIAPGSITAAMIDSSQVQARITGNCVAGAGVLSINADGTVTCGGSSTQQPFTVSTIDSVGNPGWFSSITIGSDGLGLIAYWDFTSDHLRVAHCADTACTSATVNTIDSGMSVGRYCSITIGADGLGLISYWDAFNGLKVAHCVDTACSSATGNILEGGFVGQFTSITLGSDGLGLISYEANNVADLKVAHCSNVACSSATTYTLDSPGTQGWYTSITIGTDGLGLVSYYDVTNKDLKVAHCANTLCSTANTYTLDSTGDVGYYSAIIIGGDGLGLISYFDGTNEDLKVAHCSNVACSSATASTVDGIRGVGYYSSIAIGPDGLGLISHADLVNAALKVTHCANPVCSSASGVNIDKTPGVLTGPDTSITIGADGLPLISYRDLTHTDLKVAHCANSICQSFIHRR